VRRIVLGLILSFAFVTNRLTAQDTYSLSLLGTVTTSSKLFRNARADDELLRSSFLPVNGVFSAGMELRRVIERDRLELGLSIEYISASEDFSLSSDATTDAVPARDGYSVVPVELTAYLQIPIGTAGLHVYMGGGGGLYFGGRRYEYASAPAVIVDRKLGYGIHVLGGVEVALSPTLSVRSEVKFRDIQFDTVNRFTSFSTPLNGRPIPLDDQPLYSRIDIDGMTVSVAVAYHF
jgi:hypothetical protein